MRLASHQVRIAAPIEVVWAHLATAEGLVRWVGPAATADPAPGGTLRWTHPDGSTVVGRRRRWYDAETARLARWLRATAH